jgi:hypothetical protein
MLGFRSRLTDVLAQNAATSRQMPEAVLSNLVHLGIDAVAFSGQLWLRNLDLLIQALPIERHDQRPFGPSELFSEPFGRPWDEVVRFPAREFSESPASTSSSDLSAT